jgi:DNA-binding beta-propeller fold protein YncE
MRFDIGLNATALAMVPSGEMALALGEDGTLTSLSIGGVNDVSVVDTVELPSGGYSDLLIPDHAQFAYAWNKNSTDDSGISTVLLQCDGTLTLHSDAFFPVILAEGMALYNNGQRAFVVGGQQSFNEPETPEDMRIFSVKESGGFSEIGAFDIFSDFIWSGRVAVSPDGTVGVVPNASAFSTEGGTVMVVDIGNDTISQSHSIPDLSDAFRAMFSPDGQTVLVTQVEPGRVAVLQDLGTGLEVVDTLYGIGLADDFDMVRRGGLSGTVLIPSTDPTEPGPNVAILSIDGPGTVSDLGQVEFGSGLNQIPGAIAIQP